MLSVAGPFHTINLSEKTRRVGLVQLPFHAAQRISHKPVEVAAQRRRPRCAVCALYSLADLGPDGLRDRCRAYQSKSVFEENERRCCADRFLPRRATKNLPATISVYPETLIDVSLGLT
jgi:hypothetical protein